MVSRAWTAGLCPATTSCTRGFCTSTATWQVRPASAGQVCCTRQADLHRAGRHVVWQRALGGIMLAGGDHASRHLRQRHHTPALERGRPEGRHLRDCACGIWAGLCAVSLLAWPQAAQYVWHQQVSEARCQCAEACVAVKLLTCSLWKPSACSLPHPHGSLDTFSPAGAHGQGARGPTSLRASWSFCR